MDELEPEPEVEPEAEPEAEPEETSTGDARVDEALRGLDTLTELEVAEHPAVFERIHGQLAEVLSELRTGPHDAGRAAG